MDWFGFLGWSLDNHYYLSGALDNEHDCWEQHMAIGCQDTGGIHIGEHKDPCQICIYPW